MVSLNRVVMQKSSRGLIKALGPDRLDVAEVSGKWGRTFKFQSYRQFLYPEWDICAGPYEENGKPLKFDLVLANQVWEHLDGAYDAAEMRARTPAATRQLARRQLTWLRNWPDGEFVEVEAGGRPSDALAVDLQARLEGVRAHASP